ncbi:hypothetical protein HKD42_05500 [Altererythrobacter sp. RZ02]|uniref:Uncharacterized protein n=1 Tax=Pontixanthobacter rizhaonensis TaxID=2730337 RepID=A0A848QQX1_9SPHN|nr:hypothetical protein [Pontixanthobacter rizhaonensis]NMW31508.1 hypothetical protein [Pontixanthobacter rizhaonensis]
MNGGLLALIFAGLASFLIGAYLASTGDRESGIAMMGVGLLFQVLALRQIKMLKKGDNDAR